MQLETYMHRDKISGNSFKRFKRQEQLYMVTVLVKSQNLDYACISGAAWTNKKYNHILFVKLKKFHNISKTQTWKMLSEKKKHRAINGKNGPQ